MMINKEEKKNRIIEQAIEILKTEGSAGLTMRKLASAAGMTLSNLQYYFPGRIEVLQASIRYFFSWCEKNILKEREKIVQSNLNPSVDFLDMLLSLLIINDVTDPINIIFKELCALTVHDEFLGKSFDEYYREYIHSLIVISTDILPNAEKIICLIIPYAEGYSLMGNSIPLDRSDIISMLKMLIEKIDK